MSDGEEENFCYYGKPLEPYDEDAMPRKKPITVEEQIATDSHGRRRFHGAFTGGFSAGFFNTVGSLEGWIPKQFKSSRTEKSDNFTQKPEDFMDDEDIGEFGIAPQVIRATEEFSLIKKRKRTGVSDGPIPGEPLLESLLTTGNETLGFLLLRNIGIKEKVHSRKEELDVSSTSKIYGCEMPQSFKSNNLSESFSAKYQLPAIYKEFLINPKNNTFGLEYVGLNKSNTNLFESNSFSVADRNKKLSIKGQAFGVGAFEEEDDDIYAKEDMGRYDFELTKEKSKTKSVATNSSIFDMFLKAKHDVFFGKEKYLPPVIPHSFTGKHKVKKSRFEPIPEKNQSTSRKPLSASIRATYLGEEEPDNTRKTTISQKEESQDLETHQLLPKTELLLDKLTSGSIFDRFVTSSEKEDAESILKPVEPYHTEHGTEQARSAAKMKMFGPLTRNTCDWQPNSLLCKRFNVPEPFSESSSSQKRKRTKHLIFEYQKHQHEEDDLQPGLHNSKEDTSDGLQTTLPKTVIKKESEDELNQVNSQTSFSNENNKIEVELIEPPIEIVEPVIELTERVIDLSDRIHIEEKLDLFKSIFLSSSDSEDDEDEIEKNEIQKEKVKETLREEEIKKNVMLEDLTVTKIKPLKEGILSHINFHVFQSKDKKNEGEKEAKEEVNETNLNNWYGPKAPETTSSSSIVEDTISSFMVDDEEDEWVEKEMVEDKYKHKHKKHKKDKKIKSHKKKHKRDKKVR